jgi:hypothetical protein
MRKLFTALRLAGYAWRKSIKMDVGYQVVCEDRWWLTAVLISLMSHLEVFAAEQRCALAGHDIEDIGHAGPDSGETHLYCKNCFWSHNSVLY